LIEKHRPCWAISEVGYGVGPDFEPSVVYLPRGSGIVTELLTVLAACVVEEAEFLETLEGLGLTTPRGAEGLLRLEVPEELDDTPLPASLEAAATTCVSDRLRLGVVLLESPSLLDADAVLRLRSLGLDVDVFQSVPIPPTRESFAP